MLHHETSAAGLDAASIVSLICEVDLHGTCRRVSAPSCHHHLHVFAPSLSKFSRPTTMTTLQNIASESASFLQPHLLHHQNCLPQFRPPPTVVSSLPPRSARRQRDLGRVQTHIRASTRPFRLAFMTQPVSQRLSPLCGCELKTAGAGTCWVACSPGLLPPTASPASSTPCPIRIRLLV